MSRTLSLFPDAPAGDLRRPEVRASGRRRVVRAGTAAPRAAGPLSVVESVRRAALIKNRLAFGLGGILGAFVPVAVYVVAHEEAPARPITWGLVAAGLLFSVSTTWAFGRSAFGTRPKAVGFCVLVEGVMVLSTTWGLSLAALLLLCGINAVTTGTTLALEHEAFTKGDE